VSVYDRGEVDGTSYIAMEYVDGRTLKALVQEEGPLPPARAIDLTIQVLRAVRFAHKRGIIHRDLKPHNVMVDGEDRAKVTDFGIAKAGASDMTQTGSIMGTAQYVAPEQAQGLPVSAASDLYSVGIMLFELLTARLPFDGDSAVAIALKQVGERPPVPSQVAAGIPPELDAIVLRALEKQPAARFADADAFIAALEDAGRRLAGGGASAEATSVAMPATALGGSGAPREDRRPRGPGGRWFRFRERRSGPMIERGTIQERTPAVRARARPLRCRRMYPVEGEVRNHCALPRHRDARRLSLHGSACGAPLLNSRV